MNLRCIILAALLALPGIAQADDTAPRLFVPQLLGAQYTFIDQHQDALRSPHAGPLSLKAGGDTEQSHTFGAYFGVQLPAHFQYYFDLEMFKGEGVSGATGVGAIVNGDVVHSGNAGLGKRAYVARRYLRWTLPLGGAADAVERAQDQLPGTESDRHVEAKLGRMTPGDDFDKNRYANSARTQFMDGAFLNALAWDYAADTRGYTNGLLLAYVSPHWTLRYGVYQMPTHANGQTLEAPIRRARGEQMQLTLRESPDSWALRLLVYRNIARMGVYRDALAIAEATGTTPDIQSDDRDGRHKYGYAVNAELPLADGGDTGLFARYGWNDGHTESFVFTEVDRDASLGAQVSGVHWHRPQDRLGIAIGMNALSRDHRDYLATGGCGFLLCDGWLDYGHEEIAELYYALRLLPHVTLSPDFQFIRNPGYNRDRGPARFIGIRAHVEY
ncbi:MAG: carbohydrate porin [Xanthomonadaceae bacterium]|nr:carbohydrate porin [Xanthomonadaceae bacterium]